MTKKIILIIAIVVIVGLAALIVLGPTRDKETDGGGFSLGNFFPFGQSENTPPETDLVNEGQNMEEIPDVSENQEIPRLRKISNEPVAGAVAFLRGTTTIVRFVEKGTGNVYEASSANKQVGRLTNTTIPQIVNALWLQDGSGFLAQTLVSGSEIIETAFVKINRVSSTTVENLTPYTTVISKLPTGIRGIAISPDSKKIIYYTLQSGSSWYLSNPDGTQKTLLTTHPLSEWLVSWPSSNTAVVQSKPSGSANSYTYTLNISSKNLVKTGIGGTGLRAIANKDISKLLISEGGNVPRLSIYNNNTNEVINLGTNTMVEKCVWAYRDSEAVLCAVPRGIPRGNYPDSWYKGIISTEDSIRKIDVVDNVFYNNIDLTKEGNEEIDVSDIAASPDDSHLVFKNKTNGLLWMLRLEE